MEQLEDNLKAMEVKFTPEELKRVDELCPPGGNFTPFYEANFGPHPNRV
jgi:aryl-alcohol dehydrogenase-like predicted oxidoreductase